MKSRPQTRTSHPRGCSSCRRHWDLQNRGGLVSEFLSAYEKIYKSPRVQVAGNVGMNWTFPEGSEQSPPPETSSPLATRALTPRTPSSANKSYITVSYSGGNRCSGLPYNILIVGGVLDKLRRSLSHTRYGSPQTGKSSMVDHCKAPLVLKKNFGSDRP